MTKIELKVNEMNSIPFEIKKGMCFLIEGDIFIVSMVDSDATLRLISITDGGRWSDAPLTEDSFDRIRIYHGGYKIVKSINISAEV